MTHSNPGSATSDGPPDLFRPWAIGATPPVAVSAGRTSAPRGAPAPILATLTALALCGLLPLVLVASTADPSTTGWIGVLIAMMIAGARFAWIVGSRSRRPFELTTWLFFYVFLGVAPLVQLRDGADPGTTHSLWHDHDWTAAAIVIVAELALILGSTAASRSARPPGARRRIVSDLRTAIVLLVLVGSAIAYIVLVGIDSLVQTRATRGRAISAVITSEVASAIVAGFVSFGLLVAIVAWLEVLRLRRSAGQRVSALPAAIACIPLFIIVNPLGSPRYVLLTVVLGLLVALGMYGSLLRYRAVALSSVAAVVLLFPILDVFRRSLDIAGQTTDPLSSLKDGDFDSFGQIINTAHYVSEHGITWGNQLLGVLLFWVPRDLWPGKPTDTGVLLAQFRGYWFTNLSAPLPAELFINGGWAALVVGGVLLGYALRRWDLGAELQLSALGVPTVLGCVLPFYLVFLLRGSLLQATATLAVILVTWFLVSVRVPDSVADGRAGPH